MPAGPMPGGPAPYYPGTQPTAPRRRRTGLIVAIVLACLVLAGAGVGAVQVFGGHGTQYPVGSCVTQHGDRAETASCGTTGAYRVTRVVSDRAKCPDPSGPAIELDGVDGDPVRCLELVKH